jgi:transposase
MISCDREAINPFVLHGQRKAARIAGLSKNTVKNWADRYRWNKLLNLLPIERTQSPAAIVADEPSQNKNRSILALSRHTTQTSEKAEAQKAECSK